MPAAIPPGLGAGGRALWRDIVKAHDGLDAVQLVQLQEACRAKDRLDKLDEILRGEVEVWTTLVESSQNPDAAEVKIDGALQQANATANLMKQLLAAMRLADPETGKKPQYRGPRGAQAPSVPRSGGKVSSLDRARAAKSS